MLRKILGALVVTTAASLFSAGLGLGYCYAAADPGNLHTVKWVKVVGEPIPMLGDMDDMVGYTDKLYYKVYILLEGGDAGLPFGSKDNPLFQYLETPPHVPTFLRVGRQVRIDSESRDNGYVDHWIADSKTGADFRAISHGW